MRLVPPGQVQTWKLLVDPKEKLLKNDVQHGDLGIGEDSTANLIRNFLDCIKSRNAPLCSLEDSHRSTSFAHMASTAMAMSGRIEWHPDPEQVTNNPAANELLHYKYRSPWTLI